MNRDHRSFSTGQVVRKLELVGVTVDRATVKRWFRSRRVPALRTLGGHWRVMAADLDALIARLRER